MFFSDPWKCVELLNLMLFLTSMILRVQFWSSPLRNELVDSENLEKNEYYDQLGLLAHWSGNEKDTNAVNVLLSFLHLFKYLKLNKVSILVF